MVKSHLSLAIVLGLGITSVYAGELTFSPTVESRLSASSSELGSADQQSTNEYIILNELDFDIDYESNFLTSKINVNAFDKHYEKESENDDTFLTYSWNNTLSLLNELWVSDAYYEYDYELLNNEKSTFNDLMYQTGEISDVERYGIVTSYSLPKRRSAIQGSIDSSFKSDIVSAGIDFEKRKQTQADLNIFLNQGDSSKNFQWRAYGYAGEKESDVGINNSDRNGGLLFRIPTFPKLMTVASANYIYQKSKNPSLYDETGDIIEYASYGGGVAYYDGKKGNLFQITASLDSRDDDYFFGTEFRFNFGDDHYINGKVERKFYGDAGELNYFYSSGRNIFEVYYEEDVELRYMLEQEITNRGLYVCSDGVDSFDDSFCWKPQQLNYELKPGETLIPKIDVNYPLVDRLTLNKSLGFNWSYKNDFFNSKFQVYKNTMEEIDESYEQESDNISLLLSHRLNSLSSVEYEIKYRKMTFLPVGNRTYDSLYKATYSHELNSRAKWSISLQHVGKKSGYEIDNFKELRFTLSYEHHFGKKNKRARNIL